MTIRTGKTGVRIDLHQNFRSRGEVLGPVNEIFRKIMRRELGGIDYGEAEALRMGASYPDQEDAGRSFCSFPRKNGKKPARKAGGRSRRRRRI